MEERGGDGESTGNRDGESEAIWKVISSLNAVYLFINERKVFSKPGRQKTEEEGEGKKNTSLFCETKSIQWAKNRCHS